MNIRRTTLLIAGMAAGFATMVARDVVLKTVPHTGLAQADVYVGCDGRRWQLLWDYVDSACYNGVEIVCSPNSNEVYSREAEVTLFSVSQGNRNVHAHARVAYDTDCFAVGLKRGAGGNVRLLAGEKTVVSCDTAIFRGVPDSRLLFRPGSDYKRLRRNADIVGLLPLQKSRFEVPDSLFSYLRASTDSYEGLWEYLDRDMPENRVVPGGKYRLATVRDPYTGKYDIIYVSGASIAASRWPGLAVKGKIAPTVFPDNFDLVWTDAYRTAVYDDETSATFSADGALLSLNFPLFGAGMRFRRVRL